MVKFLLFCSVKNVCSLGMILYRDMCNFLIVFSVSCFKDAHDLNPNWSEKEHFKTKLLRIICAYDQYYVLPQCK